MMEAVRTSEMSVDNHFTRQYIPEDNSEQESIELVSTSGPCVLIKIRTMDNVKKSMSF
jgi:hypothetical protein